MFEFCHILGFYTLTNIVINLKIFHRKFNRGLVGHRPGPKPPLYLRLKKKNCHATTKMAKNSSNFTCRMIAIVFWTGLCDAIRHDRHRFLNKISCDFPRFSTIHLAIHLAIRSPLFFGTTCYSIIFRSDVVAKQIE